MFMGLCSKITATLAAICAMSLSFCSCESSSTLPPPNKGDNGSAESDMTEIYDYVRSYQTA